MSRATQREAGTVGRAERAAVKAARSLADFDERRAVKADGKRDRGTRRTTAQTDGVELARDEAARLRGSPRLRP